MGQPSSDGVLDRSVLVLDAVANGAGSLSELVTATSLPRATAHRLAVALERHGLLGRDGTGRYAIGLRVRDLAATVPDTLIAAAAPVLLWVRDESDESAQLYRRDGAQRVCVAAAERPHGLRTTVPLGSRLPLSAGSGAQVLVAWSDPPDLPTGAQFTARGLADVRRRGWAVSVAQREAGVASVSAPVLDGSGFLLAAVSISGPVERLGRSPGVRLGPLLVQAASRISASLA